MRTLVLGDIHGCSKALETLAQFVPFEPDDMIITLGDYVDRGPDSRGVLNWLIERYRQDRLIPLRGNHEIMMLQARDSSQAFTYWRMYGGDATLASYGHEGGEVSLRDVPDEHWDFMEYELYDWYETHHHFFVHANVVPELPLDAQPDLRLFWEPFDHAPPHCSGKIMICGHTAQKTGEPINIGHAICIDTWVYGAGWLTCLDFETGKYWQANQQRSARTGQLQLPNREADQRNEGTNGP